MMVMVREVRWVIFFLLLLPLIFGARHRLHEHLLWRNGAECHKASSGAEGTQKEVLWFLRITTESKHTHTHHTAEVCEEFKSWILTEQIQRCAWGTTGIWRCIVFLEGEKKRPYAGTWGHVSVEEQSTRENLVNYKFAHWKALKTQYAPVFVFTT